MNAPQVTSDHGRAEIVNALKAEIIGPDPAGAKLNLVPQPNFTDLSSSFGPWVDAATNEEILNDGRIGPMRRYASGVLFPEKQTGRENILDDAPIIDVEEQDEPPIERLNLVPSRIRTIRQMITSYQAQMNSTLGRQRFRSSFLILRRP